MSERERFWLTPPDIYEKLDAEFGFDFDPCPCPKPDGYNSLELDWGNVNYVNPPFRKADGGPTAFVRKAIEEQAKGRTSVLLLPVPSLINLLVDANAEMRSMGRVRWREVLTGEPMKSPGSSCLFILRGKQ